MKSMGLQHHGSLEKTRLGKIAKDDRDFMLGGRPDG